MSNFDLRSISHDVNIENKEFFHETLYRINELNDYVKSYEKIAVSFVICGSSYLIGGITNSILKFLNQLVQFIT